MTHEQPEYPSPRIVDSRRLTGPNLYCALPGAVLEVVLDAELVSVLPSRWARLADALCDALGWPRPESHARPERAGATLFFTAPIDVLMTATEVNEQAFAFAEAGQSVPAPLVERLRALAESERGTRPHLAALHDEAHVGNLSVTFDDEAVTLGSGAGSCTWPLDAIPAEIPWETISEVPIALVTGSNGKTTTTRLLAAMWRAAGRTPAWSCSDGVWIGDEQVESGDYSGPAGARVVLRDKRVSAAVLETARGGMLRRGLAVSRADAAIITNISADHFGEYGIDTLRELAEVKGIVARALGGGGCLVLNADDTMLVDLAGRLNVRLAWFSALPAHPVLDQHVSEGCDAATVFEGRAMLHVAGVWTDMGSVDAMPLALKGAAPHNVENLLGAALLGAQLGIPLDCIRDTLARFGAAPADNPGRLELRRFGGVTLLLDYAHNPGGIAALCRTAASMPARRRLLVIGQAGNRGDDQLRALVRAALSVTRFDRVIVKEMPMLLRGRSEGEIPRVMVDELMHIGVPERDVEVVVGELDAIRRALSWSRDGDVLVCPVHVDKVAVHELLDRLNAVAWTPGDRLPA